MLRQLTLTYLIGLLLSACVSVAPQSTLLGSNGMTRVSQEACSINPEAQAVGGLDPDGFSMTSWNIYKEQRDGWKTDLEQLAQQSDILLLQEASLADELQEWLRTQELNWDMSPAFSYEGVYSGVMTAGTLSATENCSYLKPEPWIRFPKAVLASYYPISALDETLLVINLHAVNFTVGTSDLEQQLQLADEYLVAHKGPAILAGDFNTWSEERLAVVQAIATTRNMQPVAFEGQQPSQHWGETVDHVFYRGLQVRDAQVLAVESSDHFPLQVRFTFKQRL